MKKITVSILTTLLMLSMVFSSSVFAANEKVSAWDSFLGLLGINASETTDVVGVEYRGHIQNKGDYPLDPATWVQGPNRLGTVGEALRLEGFWIQLTDKPADVNIKYQVHVQNEGWMEPVLNGKFAGTEGKSQRIEAIKIWLVDDAGEPVTGYSVEYRGHVENVGDVPQTAGDWYADGAQLGTVGASQRLEALEVKIVKTKADMTAYDAAVVAAAELTEDDYTAESWEVLTDALAVEVTADNTQAEVDAATAAINAAIDALVEITHVTGVEAINSTQATVTFSGAVKSVVPANFSVTDANGNQAFVSNAVLNAAKDEATLTFFNAFANNGVYTVVTTSVKDATDVSVPTSTDSFTYVTAPVASVEFIGTTILPASNAKTLVKVTDTLGRDVTAESNVVFESSNIGVVSATGVTAIPSGTSASAIVVAKVAVGDTFVRSANTTITVSTSVATTFAGSYVYTTAAAATTADFAKLTAEQKIDFVNMGVTDKKLAAYYTDQFGKDTLSAVLAFNGTGQPTLANLNPNVVIVENDGTIKPISAGTGYVKVVNGTVTTTIKITVKAAPVVTTMTADKTAVSVGALGGLNTAAIKLEYKDQFGNVTTTLPGTLTRIEADATIATATVVDDNNVTITGLKEGTTKITLTYKDGTAITLTQVIDVTVTKAGTLAGYAVENAAATLDLNTSNTAVPKTPNTSEVKVFSVDASGNKIAELDPGTGAGQFSLVPVDATGTASNAIVTAAADTVTAAAMGTGYVQVKVNTLLISTLTYNVTNTAAVPTTATFDSLAIVLGESPTLPVLLTDKLKTMVSVKDQNGAAMTITPASLVFEYTITNITGLTFTGTANAESLATITAQSGLADIVVTKVTYPGNTANLLTTPVVVRLSATDTTKPVVTGVTEGQVGNVTTGITPAFTVGTGTLSKDGAAATAYTTGTKVAAVGAYVLTVTDTAGNATIVNFSIVTDAILAKADLAAATIDPLTVAWDTDQATTRTAILAAVDTALEAEMTNATTVVTFATPPTITAAGLAAADYTINVAITGTDTSTDTTTKVVNVTVTP